MPSYYKTFFFSLITIFLMGVCYVVNIPRAQAAVCSFESLTDNTGNPVSSLDNKYLANVTITSSTECLQLGADYFILAHPKSASPNPATSAVSNATKTPDKRSVTASLNLSSVAGEVVTSATWTVKICNRSITVSDCVGNNVLLSTDIQVTGPSPTALPTTSPGIPVIDRSAQVYCVYQSGSSDVIIDRITNLTTGTNYTWWWDGDMAKSGDLTATGTEMSFTVPQDKTALTGVRSFCINRGVGNLTKTNNDNNCIPLKFTAADPGADRACSSVSLAPAHGPSANASAIACAVGDETGKNKNEWTGVDTAIGCVPTRPTAFINSLLKFAMGIGGGIALLLMIAGSFQMITSAGNPESLKKGQEQFTSAIIGLLFIIFSVLLLQIIGTDILGIPGFGK